MAGNTKAANTPRATLVTRSSRMTDAFGEHGPDDEYLKHLVVFADRVALPRGELYTQVAAFQLGDGLHLVLRLDRIDA